MYEGRNPKVKISFPSLTFGDVMGIFGGQFPQCHLHFQGFLTTSNRVELLVLRSVSHTFYVCYVIYLYEDQKINGIHVGEYTKLVPWMVWVGCLLLSYSFEDVNRFWMRFLN